MESLQAGAAVLADNRELPVLVLAPSSAATWHRISRGSPLEQVLEGPTELGQIRAAVEELLEKSRFLHQRLVGVSAAIEDLRERILVIGPTPISVLITGESGTGKDVVATAPLCIQHHRAIHSLFFQAVAKTIATLQRIRHVIVTNVGEVPVALAQKVLRSHAPDLDSILDRWMGMPRVILEGIVMVHHRHSPSHHLSRQHCPHQR